MLAKEARQQLEFVLLAGGDLQTLCAAQHDVRVLHLQRIKFAAAQLGQLRLSTASTSLPASFGYCFPSAVLSYQTSSSR